MAKKRELDNIDRDCMRAMALGYGVHYGRYKVDFPNTAEIPPEEVPRYAKRECKQCGTEFIPGYQNQVYCCEECRIEYNRLHTMKNPNRARQKFCRRCGKPIIDPKQRVFCGKVCLYSYDQERRHRKKKES